MLPDEDEFDPFENEEEFLELMEYMAKQMADSDPPNEEAVLERDLDDDLNPENHQETFRNGSSETSDPPISTASPSNNEKPIMLSEASRELANSAVGGGHRNNVDDLYITGKFMKAHPEIRYGLGEWRRYKNGIWEAIDENEVKRLMMRVALVMRNLKRYRITDGKIRSAISLLQYEVALPADAWNANHNIIVFTNGVLDIPSKTLMPFDPNHFATRGVNYDYDPNAQCPVFRASLARLGSSTDLLQEFVGYALTPDCRHEISIWLHGVPGGGKSTILDAISATLSSLVGSLGLKEIEKSRFALAAIPGKTLLVATENPQKYLESTDVVNKIISGETITVEKKFKDAYDIKSTAKILWAMNDLPSINGPQNGLTRRVKVISWPSLSEVEKDPDIKARIMAELPGILNWALEGLDRLKARGRFLIPDAVKRSTAAYVDSNDVFKNFIEDMCEIQPEDQSMRTTGQNLYNAYADWCRMNGEKPVSSTKAANEWRRFGLGKRKIKGISIWVGIRVFPRRLGPQTNEVELDDDPTE